MGAGHRAPGGRLGILGPVTRAEPRSGRGASGDGDVGAGDADGNICLRGSARGRVCCQNTDRFQSQNRVVGARPRPQDAAPPGGSLAPAPSPGPSTARQTRGEGCSPRKPCKSFGLTRRAQGHSGRGGMFWKAVGRGEQVQSCRMERPTPTAPLWGRTSAVVTPKPSPSTPARKSASPDLSQDWEAGLEMGPAQALWAEKG